MSLLTVITDLERVKAKLKIAKELQALAKVDGLFSKYSELTKVITVLNLKLNQLERLNNRLSA